MKHITSFTNFLNEIVEKDTVIAEEPALDIEKVVDMPDTYLLKWRVYDHPADKETTAKRFDFEYEIKHSGSSIKGINLKDSFVLAMSKNSVGLYSIGEDVEKFCGIPKKDAILAVKDGKETEENALIYGMSNIMNGGKDIYFWTNGSRLGGQAKKQGALSALMEQLSHEAGVHLSRKILVRMIAKNKGIDITTEDWVSYDYGTGEYNWPAIGDPTDEQPIVMIDEETMATTCGAIVSMIAEDFFKMAATYVPQAVALTKM